MTKPFAEFFPRLSACMIDISYGKLNFQMENIIWDKVYLGRPYHLNFFKGFLSQISLGPLLNTFSHISMNYVNIKTW